MRAPLRYRQRFTRREPAAAGQLPTRSFTVYAWNRQEAAVAADRELEAAGEDPKAWWAVGVERAPF